MSERESYDVEGVMLPQPFKIRRLGHFGVDVEDIEKGLRFYVDDLGFRITDIRNLDELPRARHLVEGSPDPNLYFTSHNTDHHAFLINHKAISRNMGVTQGDITVNQLSWQVGSLKEVVDGYDFLKAEGADVLRIGRDMPGANWHVYFRDPDGHQNELYYGMEQLGWQRHSRPEIMYDRGFRERPDLPQMSEAAEIEQAVRSGIDIHSGYTPDRTMACEYDVGGILLPRPFKITRIGPAALFVKDVARSVDFYTRLMGFQLTEETSVEGQRCAFLRAGSEHHVLAFYPDSLRGRLGLGEHSTLAAFGLEVGSYRQLCDAVAFLKGKGWRFVDNLPSGLFPGIDYAAFVIDPEGHCMMLYYYMEQIGWDGKPRPADQRRAAQSPWPDTLPPLFDTYADQIFQGPLG